MSNCHISISAVSFYAVSLPPCCKQQHNKKNAYKLFPSGWKEKSRQIKTKKLTNPLTTQIVSGIVVVIKYTSIMKLYFNSADILNERPVKCFIFPNRLNGWLVFPLWKKNKLIHLGPSLPFLSFFFSLPLIKMCAQRGTMSVDVRQSALGTAPPPGSARRSRPGLYGFVQPPNCIFREPKGMLIKSGISISLKNANYMNTVSRVPHRVPSCLTEHRWTMAKKKRFMHR